MTIEDTDRPASGPGEGANVDVGAETDWRAQAIWLQFQLRKRGYTQAELAKLIGVHQSTVNNVLHGRETSHRVATKVAELLGRPIDELFPGRYVYRPRSRSQARR